LIVARADLRRHALDRQDYAFFAAYVVVQYIVLGTAWNILGGYTGYVNFGITAFFAIGAYSTVVLHKLVPRLPLPAMIVLAA
jgi:branched-chain amino acid transport system permease protein